MEKVYLINCQSKVKGSNEPYKNVGILCGFKTYKEALKNYERLNNEENLDSYLEFHYYIESVIIY